MSKSRRRAKTKRKVKQEWYAKGRTKYGDELKQRILKDRLSIIEVDLLTLFRKYKLESRSKAKSMLQMLSLYEREWPDRYFTTSLMSRYLQSLKDNWFLDYAKGLVVMTDKSEERYKPIRKALYWLSKKAKDETITVDKDRWIMINGEYVADEKTRARRTNRKSSA